MRLGSSSYASQRLAYGCCRLHHECRDTDSTVRQEEGFFSTARGASVARHGVRCCVRCQRVRYEVLRAVVRTRMIGARAQAKTLVLRTRRSAAGRSGRGLNGKLGLGVVTMTAARPKEPVPGSRTLSHRPGPSLENFQRSPRKSSIETTKATPPTGLWTTSPKEVARAALAPNSQALPGAEHAAGAPRGKGSPWWA